MAALSATGSGVECHGVVLCGSSVFGLAAADGVTSWCEEQGRGLALDAATVPVVGAAVVYDLRVAGAGRPGPESGRAACEAASESEPPMGRVGVGAGCTVGKTAGAAHMSPGGQGWAVESAAGVTVGVMMAVNSVGDVFDERGDLIAGCTASADTLRYPEIGVKELRGFSDDPSGHENTVIGCLVTNARLSKADACRAADVAHNGIARAVAPAHTSLDGDTLFLLCTGEVETHVDLVADLGSKAVAAAIRAAVRS